MKNILRLSLLGFLACLAASLAEARAPNVLIFLMDEITKQNASEQSMMPAGLIITPNEMHDMIAYLKAPLETKKKKKNRNKKK